MRSREARRQRTRLARWARWLGFDRNPLRRGSDRIEAALRLVLIVLLVVAVPIAAVVAGRQADHLALRQAQAQRTADHLVTAVLLKDAPTAGTPDPYTSVQTAWVPARWQPPGQPARTGVVLALAGAHQGSTVRIWINASGAVTDPPLDHRDVTGQVCVAVMATCLVSLLVLLASAGLTRRALDRRRLSAWEAEWQAGEPLWSGRRH
jgi:hypothetical protein